ncbi:MAG: hypothetical protein GQ534_02965 [Candidatus Delongbacteria bacterium]|nr:hypothetical protein [Candidatus Delongbacteria bacterium]
MSEEENKEKNQKIILESDEILEKLKNILAEATTYKEDILKNNNNCKVNSSKINELQQKSVNSSDEIVKIQNETKATLDEISKQKTSLIESITNDRNQTEIALNKVQELKEQVEILHNESTKISGKIETLHKSSINSNDEVKKIASIADTVDNKVNDYQEYLENSKIEYENIKVKIQDLLPGATSAGLSTAFYSRREKYENKMKLWTTLRFVSIASFIIYGIWIFKDIATLSGDVKGANAFDLIKLWLSYLINKSPIIAGLIMLEEFVRRTYNRNFRLEEDYAFKQVMSHTFEGYKKQLSEMSEEKDTLVAEFTRKVLNIITKNPGRLILDEKELNFAEKVMRNKSNQTQKIENKI